MTSHLWPAVFRLPFVARHLHCGSGQTFAAPCTYGARCFRFVDAHNDIWSAWFSDSCHSCQGLIISVVYQSTSPRIAFCDSSFGREFILTRPKSNDLREFAASLMQFVDPHCDMRAWPDISVCARVAGHFRLRARMTRHLRLHVRTNV